ncbi:MAG: thioredoxin reductase, partial [Chloroflexota bacterium]|nr:thioredoxin reductase [Chloroflexota bacterium]
MRHPTFREHQVRLVGHRWSPRVHELKRFLGRSGVAYRWLDLEFDDPETKRILAELAEQPIAFPIVLLPDGSVLSDPDVHVLAERLGLPTEPADSLYDLVVIGAGPAGLAAAIHGASEGLHSVVVEKELPGGQASFSAAIENYPGFPRALDGSILARRTVEQAERFGVEFVMTRRATRLDLRDGKRVVTLDDGADLAARAVLIAIGVSFRWLDAPGCASLVGAGLYYGAATVEASACRGQDVYVLGGGNSAGQAALFLARYARSVHILTLDDSLEPTMSRYLIKRIERIPNIVVHAHATVAEAGGPGHLEWLVVRDTRTGELRRVPATALFVFIGAVPRSDWLDGRVDRDEDGFILSGLDYLVADPPDWPLGRRPYLLETRTPGVFVAGDVRKGSVQR